MTGRRRDQCYTVDIEGEPVIVRGRRPPSEQDRAMLAELVAAVRRKAAEEPEGTAEMERRQAAAFDRIRERRERLTGD